MVTRAGQNGGNEEVENNDVEKEDDNRAAEYEGNEIVISEMNKEVEKRDKSKRKEACDKMENKVIPSQHLPYPHAPLKKDNVRKHARFMDIFKQLHINIPFAEALEKMPKYAKLMKNMLTKKKRYTDKETVLLDARCSTVIQRNTPRKESDLGRVTLPLTIGSNYIGKGLIDPGSNINLILLFIVKRLGNIVMKPTRMTLQLADKTITSSYGVAQDMLVKVDKFFFPVDFVVVDMEEDREVPLILGRPFMKTARMIIDIDEGLMKVRVQDEEVKFNLFKAKKHPKNKKDIFRIDATEGELKDAEN
ncbi:uncharacterized protein LOC131630229 [Vicia villosa]|uniref:uncharacterized protein LOC131630229 n=1 Tax=Vicia villosa TaxID=3911 RepID=UPI00273BCEC2|nr:uncharacterized protein LOC131630229 [Vicia villosa]